MLILMVIVEDLSKCVCFIHDSSGLILRECIVQCAGFLKSAVQKSARFFTLSTAK